MAIGLKTLMAGSGYEYLTRQVAPGDTEPGAEPTLTDYYTAQGETPGRWWGAGLAGMGLEAGEVVTAEQMKRLFGAGLDPVTGAKLGRAYSVFSTQPTPFETELDHRLTGPSHHQHPNPTTDTSHQATASASERTEGKDMNRQAHARTEIMPKWLSIQQAAATYGVSVDTIRRRIATGKLPASRCGGRIIRVRITDLDQLFRPLNAA